MKWLILSGLVPCCLSLPVLAEESPFAGSRVDTVAGEGGKGYEGDGGAATEARLDNPFGVIVGPGGDIWFCDTGNHVIRRISRRKGTIDTVVGTGAAGYSGDGGAPADAELFEPYELRFHPGGDLYWVEMRNHVVRRWDAKRNVVETVAGTGESGFGGDGGPATEAILHRPHSIQFDDSGDFLYICDIGNHRIRRVQIESNRIKTWCGNGERAATPDRSVVGPETPLNGPRALDRGPGGDLWLALREGNALYRIGMEDGLLHHVAGTGKKGFVSDARPALEAPLSGPKGVALSPRGEIVYLADTESHTVRAIDLGATPPRLHVVVGDGEKGDGPDSPDPLACRMARLHGVGTDPVTGDLYIGDSETNKVRRVTGLPGDPRKGLGNYRVDEFTHEGRSCRVAIPDEAADGRPWIWRCRFWGAFPAVDEALLAEGWHVAWIDVANEFGGPVAMDAFDSFYAAVRTSHDLAPRVVMEGFSRGGLAAMNWAIRNPEKTRGLYLDAPVLDIRSWPRNQSDELWRRCLEAYGITESGGEISWKGPLDRLDALTGAGVPLFVVAGSRDEVVPYEENAAILVSHYHEKGGSYELVLKAGGGHHPHSLHDPTPVVSWARALAP